MIAGEPGHLDDTACLSGPTNSLELMFATPTARQQGVHVTWGVLVRFSLCMTCISMGHN